MIVHQQVLWHHLLICISNLQALKPIKVYTSKIWHKYSKSWFFKCILQLQIWRHVGYIYVKFQEVNPAKILQNRISPRSFQASSHKLRRDSLCLCRAKRSWEKFFFRWVKFRFRPVFVAVSRWGGKVWTKKTPQKNRNWCDTLEIFGWNENFMRWTTIQNCIISMLCFSKINKTWGKKWISTRKLVLLDKLLRSEAPCHDFKLHRKIVVILS